MNESHWWLPPVISKHGLELDRLWTLITVLVGVTFVGVEALLVWLCIRYRARRPDAPRKALYTHGSHRLEVAWTLVPAVILVVLAVGSNAVWARVKQHRPADDEIGMRLNVLAQRFTWNVYYPGPDGLLDTEDDLRRERKIVVPVDETVLVRLSSKDVLHSFFIPLARIKQDAVPGYWGNLWFTLTQPSDPGPDGTWLTADDRPYDLVCAELCGDSHYDMYGSVFAVPRDVFDAWVAAGSP